MKSDYDKPALRWIEERIETLSDLVSYSTEQHAFCHACHAGLAEPRGTRLELSLREPKGRRTGRTIT